MDWLGWQPRVLALVMCSSEDIGAAGYMVGFLVSSMYAVMASPLGHVVARGAVAEGSSLL